MKVRIVVFLACFIALIHACVEQEPPESPAPQPADLAKTYCGSCHAFPDPSLLDKNTWEKSVLPKMSEKLGIRTYNGQYMAVLHELPGETATDPGIRVSFNDWIAIVNYYVSESPEKLPPPDRPDVQNKTALFTPKPVAVDSAVPSTCFLKIDPGNRVVYAANVYDSLLMVFDSSMRPVQKIRSGLVAVDMLFDQELTSPGIRTGLITAIGNFYPNRERLGSIQEFRILGNRIEPGRTVDTEVARPVQTVRADMDGDGLPDIVVCAFGHDEGEFYYLKAGKGGDYTRHMLNPSAGAINPYVEDMNGDGLPDIIVMFAQGDEGVYLYTNKGGGHFTASRILQFSPVHGSSHMELTDLNGDGLKDILYTCGDNYDYSRVLKPYHGVYIFINGGKGEFRRQYFFPMHGCYKAVARDFDNDGDMDLAAISFFPDQEHHPEESFIYLQNKGGLDFEPFIIEMPTRGRWLTLDAGDLDGDGDEDIVLGNMTLNENAGRPREGETPAGPSILLLENQSR